ncbi:MAG TPA: FG-GAP-like repeat-containing protein [Gaiellaceae bacterium]|nr:FG-GAP-like repeat-containing protein [Gaiellaceae bacterium]
MSAPRAARPGSPALRIRGTEYPVLLPTLRDPRLHLAAVITSLQVLGQTSFGFELSIAQILVSLGTCAVLEVGIALRRQRVLMWPASALLTGNGVAFILRVPGTEHGDWWSLHGWPIFAGTAAVALLSKYLITFRGQHVFNPSNIGLVLCFLLLGSERADPLDLWWGPMSAWLALALAIIVGGGLVILGRLRLLEIAFGFWLAFAAGIAVLAASGHAMVARWHLGPIEGWEFWRVLVFSPEILVFLFFMITDPKTIPAGRAGRRAYAASIGLVAVLLIAPQTTEFATKVAVLAALALVCGVRPVVELLRERAASVGRPRVGRVATGSLLVAGSAAFAGLVVLAGIPARATEAAASPAALRPGELPQVTVVPAKDVASEIDRATALRIAADLVAALRIEAEALAGRDTERAADAAAGARLAALWQRIGAAGDEVVAADYNVERVTLTLEPGEGQGPPLVVAELEGTAELVTWAGSPPEVVGRGDPAPFAQTLELELQGGRYVIVGSRGGSDEPAVAVSAPARPGEALGGLRLVDVARHAGLDFRHGAFRFAVSPDPVAMMGGGLCWVDADGDGWLDLFAVNSYSVQVDVARWKERGGLPRSALFLNERGRFVDVSRGSGADVSLRGNGCVAADLNADGRTDLYVTAAGYDALLWNAGGGKFVEGARAAGIADYGWHTAAAVGDVNGDGLPDLFVAGYADLNAPVEGGAGFPSNYAGVRDLLYLNEGPDARGRSTFREVGVEAGLEGEDPEHGLGAVFTDVDGDGRLDLYVANDLDPNRLYLNVGDDRPLGFRFREVGGSAGVADENAGMGVAAGDYDGDGRADLFVTNSHRQLHGVFRSRPAADAVAFADARPAFAPAFDTSLAGWGAAWADLDLDADLDLVYANGAIPVTDLAAAAEPVRVVENLGGRVADASAGLRAGPLLNGRGLAAADYDNDGDVDVAVGSIGGRLVLLRNGGARGNWLEVDLGFAPGATVTAVLPGGKTLVREVLAGSSYLSSEDPRVHFGLGEAERVSELLVRFPDGRELRLTDLAANRLVSVGG